MHSAKARRVGVLVFVLFALALPAAAQPNRESGVDLGRIVSSLWERLSAPLVSLWEKGGSVSDPEVAPTSSAPTPPPPTDGRGMIDPDG
jgi:hypothetical protein